MMLREKGQWIESGSVGRCGLGRKVKTLRKQFLPQKLVDKGK